METIKLKVFSPQGLLIEKDINQLETTTAKGRVGLNVNQPKFIAHLEPNITVVSTDTEKQEYVVVSGLLVLDKSVMTIFTEDFCLKSDINLENLSLQITQLKEFLLNVKDETKTLMLKQLLTKYETKLALAAN